MPQNGEEKGEGKKMCAHSGEIHKRLMVGLAKKLITKK